MKLLVYASLILSVISLITACGQEQESTLPKMMKLTEGVYASGYVEAENQYKVFSTASGILEEWYVKEGDTIQKGDLLLHIEGTSSSLNTDNARLALELAENNYSSNSAVLRELELNLQSAREKFINDSINYERNFRLQEQKIGAKADLDRSELAMKTSENNYKALQKRINATQQQLGTEMRSARNRYKISQNSSRDFTITSKMSGLVYSILKEQGELVMIQEPIALIGSFDNFVLRLKIDELDLGKIKLEDKIIITLDAYENEFFEAKMTRIYPSVDKQTQTFMIEAVLVNPPLVLKSGLSAEANIVVAEKENALVIPKAYLINRDSVKTGKTAGKRIEIGLKNLEYVEVLSGLDANTKIYKP